MNTAVNAIQNLLTTYQQKTALEMCRELNDTMADFQEMIELDSEANELLNRIAAGEFGNKGKISYYGGVISWDFGG